MLKEFAISFDMPSEKILVTKDVENIADEAKSLNELKMPHKRIILVTPAILRNKMNRLFEKQGLEIIPFKVRL